MQLAKGSAKKLKTISSLDTEITLSENGQSQIKISVKSPREQKQKYAEQSRIQIIGIPQEDQTIRLSTGNNKKLLKIPIAVGKKENSLFNTDNFEAMLQSVNEDHMRMMIRNTEVNQDNISRDMNETSLLMILNQSIKQSKYKLQEQPKTSKADKKQKDQQPLPSYISKQAPSIHPLEKQDHKKKLKRVNSDFQIMSQTHQSINNQQHFYHNYNTKITDQLGKKVYETAAMEKSVRDKQKIQKKTAIKISQIENQRQKRSSGSRLKLRDYLFKTQVSSAKALLQRKQRKNEKQHKQATQKVIEVQQKKTNSKYSMTNQMLCQILKAQIESQLNESLMHINTLKKILKKNQLKSDTTNQELTRIFCLRKGIKEEVNQKLANLIQKLIRIQESNKQKTNNSSKNTEKMIHI